MGEAYGLTPASKAEWRFAAHTSTLGLGGKAMSRVLITESKWAIKLVLRIWMLIFCAVCGAALIIRRFRENAHLP
jgi:hypothetical protein